MIQRSTRTWDELEIFYEDLDLRPEDIDELSWFKQGVSKATWGRYSVTISTGPYSGRLVIPGRCIIDIEEMVPGTVEALLPQAYSGIKRAEELGHAGAARVPAWEYLLELFAEMLYAYVSGGIRRNYLPRQLDTSLPRGRIDLARTIAKHRARGHPEIVSCSVRELTDDSPFHRLLVSAAARANRALGARPQNSSLRALRRAMVAMSGVPLERSPDFDLSRVDLGSNPAENLAALADMAEVIVLGISALPEQELFKEQPASVWINVEAVFEQAMRRTIAQLTTNAVSAGVADHTRLLNRGALMEADPDIVIKTGSGTVIADAKYRRHGSAVKHGEIYQLIAHATAYRARNAALVTPRISEDDADRFLGYDNHGCGYEVIVVDANSAEAIKSKLGAWMQRVGAMPATAVSEPLAPATPALT